MKHIERLLIWDFDGTLGYRVGGWTAAVLDVLRYETTAHAVTGDQLRLHLQTGFPWHSPEDVCLVKRSAEQWWDVLDKVFEQAFVAVGIEGQRAHRLAKEVRNTYPNLAHWRLFDDAVPTLEALLEQGWSHVVLTNHVPEFRLIADHLQLSPHFVEIFNSAETGYEKPHPQAFHNVVTTLGNPKIVWMIGDSLRADVAGAEAIGIPAILVRNHHQSARYFCHELSQLGNVVSP